MANTYNQALIFWRDVNNKTASSFWTIQRQTDSVPGDLIALASAAQACSNAAIVAVQYQTTHLFTSVPVAADYRTVWDRCNMQGRIGATGVYTHYDLVAPRVEIFKPDHTTLDLTNPDVAALVTAMEGTLGDAAGNPLTVIKRGRRQWAGPNS